MSKSLKPHKSLAGWTLVDSKGEVMPDDGRSDSSESSTELNFPLEECLQIHIADNLGSSSEKRQTSDGQTSSLDLSQMIVGGIKRHGGFDHENQINRDEEPSREEESKELDERGLVERNNSLHIKDIVTKDEISDVAGTVQKDVNLQACNIALIDNDKSCEFQHLLNKDQVDFENENKNHDDVGFSSEEDGTIQDQDYLNEAEERSDSDSDFVQLDEENLEVFGAELNWNDAPNRSPSIAEGFHFLGPQVDAMREGPPQRLYEEDPDYNHEDLNEDTESSTEDAGDDRIESDQSEVGSINTLTDVGDLSAFADIGDIPLVVGNVARNYRHRPNNRLSTALNITLVLVSILTMGISIGLIVATDQEIEEWQNAYLVQVKKVSSLEWTLNDMERAIRESKTSISEFHSSKSAGEAKFQTKEDNPQSKTFDSKQHDLEELQQSLIREQERALHWQNLYLLERRQREWERENEVFEDQRDRARWEKEDEEEDRRERERWEREEAENDRIERLLWEKEEQEEDKRDREKWEKERAQLDSVECLKKLMSTDFSVLRQHIPAWNASAFEDFVNTSTLMSGIANLKQSVLTSVQQIWAEAEQAVHKMRDDLKNGRQSYLDSSVMADYLKKALSLLQSQFDEVVSLNNFHFADSKKTEEKEEETVPKGSNRASNSDKPQDLRRQKKEGKPSIWNKTFGIIFKKTSQSLRTFARTVHTSWSQVKDKWDKKAANIAHKFFPVKSESESTNSFPSWLRGDSCSSLSYDSVLKGKVMSEIDSPCLWEVRDGWSMLLLNTPCLPENRYSFACNVDRDKVVQFKKDLKNLLDIHRKYEFVLIEANERRKLLMSYEHFWKVWGNSKLMLKSDKEWIHCQWNYLDDSVSNTKNKEPKVIGSPCRQHVNLANIFMEVENRKSQFEKTNNQNKADTLYDDDDDYYDEADDHKDDYDDDNGSYEETDEDNSDVEFKKLEDDEVKTQIEMRYQPELKDEVDFDEENEIIAHDHQYIEKKEDYKTLVDFDRPDRIHPNSYHSKEKSGKGISKNDSYNEADGDSLWRMTWYLKRAQHRLAMRRAQEKQMWFFDMSDSREEMRREHNMEIKSGHWLFTQAKEREAQRQKSHQSDWLFERATHRREEFAKKWNVKKYGSQRREVWDNLEKQRKMKDLSTSDCLLQQDRDMPCKFKAKKDNARLERPWRFSERFQQMKKMGKQDDKFSESEGKKFKHAKQIDKTRYDGRQREQKRNTNWKQQKKHSRSKFLRK